MGTPFSDGLKAIPSLATLADVHITNAEAGEFLTCSASANRWVGTDADRRVPTTQTLEQIMKRDQDMAPAWANARGLGANLGGRRKRAALDGMPNLAGARYMTQSFLEPTG